MRVLARQRLCRLWRPAFGILLVTGTGCFTSFPSEDDGVEDAGDDGRGDDDAGDDDDDTGDDDDDDDGSPLPRPTALDVLLLVDNSGSMGEEQRSLREALPDVVRDLSAEFDDIHVGVISSDMGVGGLEIETCDDPVFGDDGILRRLGNPSSLPELSCLTEYDRFQRWVTDSDGCETNPEACDEVADAIACVSAVGTDGCGFEQQLEAILKAVMPSGPSCTEPFCTFSMSSRGHGTEPATNGGFLRPDAMLAVVVLSDEDDCSVTDPDLFNRFSSSYFGNLNLRCIEYPDALRPVSRYADGLLSLKPQPEMVFFAVIGGAPIALVASATSIGTGVQDHDALLSDSSMMPRANADRTNVRPSCSSVSGVADPPRRFTLLARELEDRGAAATVQSICRRDLSLSFADVIVRLRTALAAGFP